MEHHEQTLLKSTTFKVNYVSQGDHRHVSREVNDFWKSSASILAIQWPEAQGVH